MNVLILGSGGREHTLAWKISQSPTLGKLYVAPGNAGTADLAVNVELDIMDFNKLKQLIKQERISMVVVGPEAPLVGGVRDAIEEDKELPGVLVIGPGKAGALLEGSKAHAKEFMKRHQIPTAAYREFTAENLDEGKAFLQTLSPPYVLKADGLAAGKGVLILDDLANAQKELTAMLLNAKFGEAGRTVVIEEFLAGIELSCFVLTDGEHYRILPYAKDYKRIGEGDTGLNTGGMGAVSPVPFMDTTLRGKIEERIIKPSINGLRADGTPYIGFLFIGLMIVDGDPMVIEYNVRLGDPETEVVVPRINNDLLNLLIAAAEGSLHTVDLNVDEQTAVTVMAVSGGYPEKYQKGFPIQGITAAGAAQVFHAGTKLREGRVITNGGRVLAVTALDSNMPEALKKSYNALKGIAFDGMYYRRDIGADLL